MGLGWDFGEGGRPPLALIQRTLKTQFIKNPLLYNTIVRKYAHILKTKKLSSCNLAIS